MKIKLIGILLRSSNRNIYQTNHKNILIISPHPDDEIFGLGGFILKMKWEGCKIQIILLTDGESSGIWPDKEEIRKHRVHLSERVCSLIGINISDITRLHLTDGKVPHPGQDGYNEAVNSVRSIINAVKPDAVFSTHTLDFWPGDHVACAKITVDAIKQSEVTTQLLYFWVWAWYNLRLGQILKIISSKLQKIDIHDQLKFKKALQNIYLNEVTPEGKPWSGNLPEPLLEAFNYPFEIVERIF